MTVVPAGELGWVGELLGLRLAIEHDVLDGRLDRMAGLALRRNPRRAHLLVSTCAAADACAFVVQPSAEQH